MIVDAGPGMFYCKKCQRYLPIELQSEIRLNVCKLCRGEA